MEVKVPPDVPGDGGVPPESVIVVEIYTNDRWVDIGHISRADQPGSMADRSFGEQGMLLFGWFLRGPNAGELEERPLVTRTEPTLDIPMGPHRLMAPGTNPVVLADLTSGPYQRTVLSADPTCVRWRLQEI